MLLHSLSLPYPFHLQLLFCAFLFLHCYLSVPLLFFFNASFPSPYHCILALPAPGPSFINLSFLFVLLPLLHLLFLILHLLFPYPPPSPLLSPSLPHSLTSQIFTLRRLCIIKLKCGMEIKVTNAFIYRLDVKLVFTSTYRYHQHS